MPFATHRDLVLASCRWLQGKKHRCSVVLAEFACQKVPAIPDVIGFRGEWSVLVECKVSKGDFHKDATKATRMHEALAPGQERWYVVPTGLVERHDVPDGWGLAWWNGKRMRVVVEAARSPGYWREGTAKVDMRLLVAALRRHQFGVQWIADEFRFEPYRRVSEVSQTTDPELARTLLRETMSVISEQTYSAGWLIGIEFLLWDAMYRPGRLVSSDKFQLYDLDRLRKLSAACGGWFRWDYDRPAAGEPHFEPIEEWLVHYREWEE